MSDLEKLMELDFKQVVKEGLSFPHSAVSYCPKHFGKGKFLYSRREDYNFFYECLPCGYVIDVKHLYWYNRSRENEEVNVE